MSVNVWEVSPAEHQTNTSQFAALNPQSGRIDGNTARNVLMKSNLPPQTLAQIWALADTDRDGMLDVREFSIAMRLTRNCIAGLPLPPTLPASLMQVPAGFVTPSVPMSMGAHPMNMSMGAGMGMSPMQYGSTPPMQQSFPVYNTAPPAVRTVPIPGGPSNGGSAFPGKQCGSWTIPHQNKLRYSQQFNQLDKQRVGFLPGQAGRGALGLSGLPTPGGFALPDSTPPELAQMCGLSRSANNSPQLEPGAPPAQKSPAPKTFEDKRMDNFAKGQAELERRRQILMEEENRRRAEIEKREREEMEKRERERMEKERRREEERLAEMERQRLLEEIRQEEERKREIEREAVRREQERIRMIEVEKMRAKEMLAQKQQEAERTAQRQQRQKTLGFQLQALDEKAVDTDAEITNARDRITEITHEIEGMRDSRDIKMKRIAELQAANQQLSVQAQELAHQLLQLQGANKETAGRKAELDETLRRRDVAHQAVEAMKAQLVQAGERAITQRHISEEKKAVAAKVRSEVASARDEYRQVLALMAQLQAQARVKLSAGDAAAAQQAEQLRLVEERSHQEELAAAAVAHNGFSSQPVAPAQHAHFSGSNSSNALPLASSTGTTKYRALYEFVARSEDELSFQPGDVVLVFEGHVAEPGWRAGQIRDKVGWFPEAFAETIGSVASSITQPIQNMPPNVTPSPSLDRIPEEVSTRHSVIAEEVVSMPTGDIVICICVAQFPWKARNDGDLTFSKGDIIEVVQQTDVKWRGRKPDGSIGWFPKSYVKLQSSSKPSSVVNSVDQTTPIAGTPAATPQHSTVNSRQASIVPSATPSSSMHQIAGSSSVHSLSSAHVVPQSPSKGEWFVAVYEFEAAESTDLPLTVGDHILVIEQNESWWKGRCNGREGIFPANYVQKSAPPAAAPVAALPVLCRVRAVADFDATAPNQLSLRVGDEIAVRERSEAGWWEGETVRDGHVLSGWFPGDYAVPVEGSVTSPGEASAVALFDYAASQVDELSFHTGDVIVVDSKADSEWWTGHRADAPTVKGLFPASYVQLR